ncbi:helix-turn-helix transcriptional regulator [Solimonas variicoloris]|uniref:helix-turn-helix transcriptional regulator n=1 Tax=Solimonas variicoloris TaxID=254408 RepID=UPI000372C640|nr:AraC family transcriptional regulator [Solimonas variicoloris]
MEDFDGAGDGPMPTDQAGGWVGASEAAITAGLSDGRVSIGRVAAELGLSERTLQRRLGHSERRYTDMLDALRQAQAEQLLRDPRLSLVEIALSLGYSEHSAFTRAFKRWTALTPQAYRHRLRGFGPAAAAGD